MAGRTVFTLGRPLGASLLLLGIGLVSLAAIGASWADLDAARQERDAQADLLERGAANGRRAPATAAVSDPFVVAETATLAAGAVDADLRALALAAGLSLQSNRADAKPDQPDGAGGIGTRIEDQAVVEGPNEALQALLVKLETGLPIVLVDDLALEPVEVETSMTSDPQAPRLRLSLTLSAYWRPGQKAVVPK